MRARHAPIRFGRLNFCEEENDSKNCFRRPNGCDRAALDWALAQGVECGGWCPKGRKAEDGPIDPEYPLKETPSASYLQRTEWNVRDSDATVLFSIGPKLSGGSKRTLEFARKHKKPHLHLCAGETGTAEALKASLRSMASKCSTWPGRGRARSPGGGVCDEDFTGTFRTGIAARDPPASLAKRCGRGRKERKNLRFFPGVYGSRP
jgi:hypothetical protein